MDEETRLRRTIITELTETNPENSYGINSYKMIGPKKIQKKFLKI